MYSKPIQNQVIEFCSCYLDCVYKAECDELHYTYGTTPANINQKEGSTMDLPTSTVRKKPKKVYATEAQKDYIIGMLDELRQDLSDYTDIEIDALTIGEASEVIDELQDTLDFERLD